MPRQPRAVTPAPHDDRFQINLLAESAARAACGMTEVSGEPGVDDGIGMRRMARIDGVLAAVGPVAGRMVIDIGCGEGEVARAFAAAGATVQGYDPFIGETGWHDEGAGRYRLSHAKADRLPEPDDVADIVLFVFSLHHVPQPSMAAALREAQRVLKPGGRLCVAEPVAEGPAQYVMAPYHDETLVRSNAAAALAEHARPLFAHEDVIRFAEPRRYADFEAYATHARLGMRYNGYGEAEITSPVVRGRFAEILAAHGGDFDQPVRINLFG